MAESFAPRSLSGAFTYTCLGCGSKAGHDEIVAGQAQDDAHRKRERESKAGERKKQADAAQAACKKASQAARTCPSCARPDGLWLAYRFEYRSGHVINHPRDEGLFVVPQSPFNELPVLTLGEYECSAYGIVWIAPISTHPDENSNNLI